MFGDLHFDQDSKRFQPVGERLTQLIEQVKKMDELGVDHFGIGEHHRPDYAVPSPEVVLAAAATVTRQIKLGSAVSVISSTDPVRLYQQFAMIDQLSGGRAEIAAGRGSFIESFSLYGYDLNDYEELFEEKLDLLLKINASDPITWTGQFRAPLNQQSILPRAVNNHLAIWIAVGGTPQSVVRAAKLGLPLVVAIIGGYPSQFKPLFELYKKTYLQAGHDPAAMQLGVHAHTFVGEDDEEVAERYYPYYAGQMDRVGRSRGWPPYQKQQYTFGRSADGALLIGDPKRVADKMMQMKEMFGLTRFSAHMDVGGPKHEDLMTSIALYATRVKALLS